MSITLKEISGRFSSVGIFEKRTVTEDYEEFVLFNKEAETWTNVLTEIFGPPRKPLGARPSKDDVKLTEELGGIWLGQTLYAKAFEDVMLVAMLWPWGDKAHTTLKLASIRK